MTRQSAPSIALYQPDIAGNTGTLMRLCACMDCQLHLIEPAGFRSDDKTLRRAGMDYTQIASLVRHNDFDNFDQWRKSENRRLVLLTTSAQENYTEFVFQPDDIILLGRESSGVPEPVHEMADARLLIPMSPSARSLNQALSGAIALGEAMRQTGAFPLIRRSTPPGT